MPEKAKCVASASLIVLGLAAGHLAAQNLVIINAHIVDGNGGVIQRGSVVVRDGRIVSVSGGTVNAAGARTIDAKGMTVMPGFIDDHRHVIADSFPPPNPVQWMKDKAAPRMQEFLDAGFTTVQSCGDPVEQIVQLQRRLNSGDVKGPRLFTAAFVQLSRPSGGGAPGPMTVDPARIDNARPPHRPTQAAAAIPDEETRAAVRELKRAGIDDVKAALVVSPGGPEKHTLTVVVDEAKKVGLPVITHAVTVEDMFAAIDAGVTILAHTPHIGQLDQAGARKVAASKIPMMSTLGIFAPTFSESNERIRERTGLDNIPRFRDLDPFPWDTVESAGQGPVNARLLWEAGVVYGYGTDTTFLPKDSLAQELKPLHLMFSNKDVVKIMTANAAAVIGHAKDLGTLESGKQADIVMLDGDPLADIQSVLNVRMVIKGGNIVVDHRALR
ncbi:MAG: amidohydrolase family protein [Bryobacteraceae bacterium]|jgi:imidazolonepropionase-like amidohydrolase